MTDKSPVLLSPQGKKKLASHIDLELQESPHALEASNRERKFQSEKPSADRSSTWARVQPSLASDSRDRWGFPLFSAVGIFGSRGHQEEVNVTDIARARSGCPMLADSSA